VKESVFVVQGQGNWKAVVVLKKNDYSIAALKSSLNSRPTHNHFIPDGSLLRRNGLCQAFSQRTTFHFSLAQ